MIRPVKSIQWGKQTVRAIEVFPMLDSTNQFARSFIKSGGRSGTVLWALEQPEGWGRRGRKWDADKSSLTFSLVWRCPKSKPPPALTLAVGLGLVEVLGDYVPDLKLKWPNDLWIGESKLGGILTEAICCKGKLWIILGIGLNVNDAPDKSGTGGRISLRQAAGCFWPRLGVLHLALLGVERGFELASSQEDLSPLFRTYGNFLDRPIMVYHGGTSFPAVAKEVLPDGRLLIKDARGERALMPEEITVRFN